MTETGLFENFEKEELRLRYNFIVTFANRIRESIYHVVNIKLKDGICILTEL